MIFGRPVAECQDLLTSEEFSDWIAYLRREPHGYDGLARIMAPVLTAVWNASIPVKKRKQLTVPKVLEDYLPPLTPAPAKDGKLSQRQRAALEKRRRERGKRGNRNS